jgi:hypothetical protein
VAKRAKPLTHIRDLVPDAENRRRRTARGARMLVDALGQVGAARSIVIDEDNIVRAGNGLVVAAAEAGITKVQVVEADGATIIAVRRRGLTPEQKRALALFDNRTGELAEWDGEQLAVDQAHGEPFAAYFDENELRRLRPAPPGRDAVVTEVPTDDVGDRFWIAIRGPLKSQAVALQQLRTLMRDVEGVEVELGTTPQPEAWTG